MIERPDRTEAGEYYFTYIDQVAEGDVRNLLADQLTETLTLLEGISEARSLDRYAPGKWTIRELVSHVNDAERVFTYRALWFARKFDSELILVHIMEQIIYPGDWSYPPLATSDFADEKRADFAARLRSLARGAGVRTDEVVRLGRAWQEIVEIVKERRADLVIVATHGYTGLRHVLLGSVAEKIVRHAQCPVLTVPVDEQDFS